MKKNRWFLYLTSHLLCFLMAVLVVGAQAPADAAARAGSGHEQGREASSGTTHYPRGWSAGPVARGTGYWRPGASRRVREVQRRLDRLGYRAGKVDGFFGPITDTAVRRYQGDHALELDGVVGSQTLGDLRTRTRRAQGSVKGRTGSESQTVGGKITPSGLHRGAPADKPAGSEMQASSDWPWWKLALLVGVILFVGVLAAVLEVARAPARRQIEHEQMDEQTDELIGEQIAEFLEPEDMPEVVPQWHDMQLAGMPAVEHALPAAVGAEAVQLASITAISSQRGRQQPGPNAFGHGTRPRDEVQIVRRIEEPLAARLGGGKSPGSRTAGSQPVNGARFGIPFRLLGARVLLSRAMGMDPPPGTLFVELELFAENECSRWETERLGPDWPFPVPVEAIEETVRALVVPHWLPALADALARDGVILDVAELARLPFAVERSTGVERALLRKELYRAG